MSEYVAFTEEMKRDYTILAPNMLPVHFKLIAQVMGDFGYRMTILETQGPQIAETGLKYIHNDTCYPAILIVGQFIDALQSGAYDPHRTALMLFQTGGGCRASNYISLLRKALERAGFGYVPVISLSLKKLETHPGFKLTLPMVKRLMFSVIYGDVILALTNQLRPYEDAPGATEEVTRQVTRALVQRMKRDGISRRALLKNCQFILDEYAKVAVSRSEKVKVGVVGEIYVKYSPLGNNNLEELLLKEGAEVVVPGLLGFCMYYLDSNMDQFRQYRLKRFVYPLYKLAYGWLLGTQEAIVALMRSDGRFQPLTSFAGVPDLVDGYIDFGCCMGEGWLLPAEMLELYHSGVKSIVCAQPFGCLPNHICGKGMMKPLKEKNPDINIVAIDYDAGASRVNQENRIRLMLSGARRARVDQMAESVV